MVDEFNALLLHISKDLKDDNLKNLTFLCNGVIGRKHLEKVKSGIDLFQYLKDMNKITHVDTAYLQKLLLDINRNDLAEKVSEFQSNNGYATRPIDDREQAKVKIAGDVIVDNLGKDWRRYGRKLGLNERKLEQIQLKHPYDLSEQVMEVINEWKRMREDDVKADQLIEALRSCKLNYTADLVVKTLKDEGFS
ncbi:hypothetical protein ACEWY4_015652 [Coilia grayii]|uniref:FADD n=1 Tax=Coilia grayii TaxID=363190 RepID=A0ABD1JNL4_9TELE